MQLREYDEAREDFQEALKMDAKCLSAYQGLAQVYLKLKDPDRAIETLLKATKIAPKNGGLWYDLASCYKCRKDWHKTAECLYTALQIEPENRDYQKALGFALILSGRIEESVAVLTRAGQKCRLCPSHGGPDASAMRINSSTAGSRLELARQANPNEQQARAIEQMLAAIEPSSPAGTGAMIAPAPESRLPALQ